MHRINKKIFSFFFVSLFALTCVCAGGRKDKLFDTIENGSVKEVKELIRNNKEYINVTRSPEKANLLMAALKEDRELDVINILLKYGANQDKKDRQKRTGVMYAAKYSSKPEVIERVIKAGKLFNFSRKNRILKKDKNGKNSFDYARENSNPDMVLDVLNKFCAEPQITQETETLVENTDSTDENQDSVLQTAPEKTEESQVQTNSAVAPSALPKVTPPVTPPVPASQVVLASKDSVTGESVTASDKNTVPESSALSKTADSLPPATTSSPNSDAQKEDNKVSTEVNASQDADRIELESTKEPVPEVSPYKKTYLFDFAEMDNDETEIPPESKLDSYHTFIENADRRDLNGRTKLMTAAKNGDLLTVENLIFSDADVNLSDNDGWTALMFACRFTDNLNVVKVLLKNGAKAEIKNNYGISALKLASGFNRNPAIVSELLSTHDAAENDVRASFIYAVTSGADISVLEVFYKKGLPLNASYDGKTPLMYAAETGRDTKIISWLLSNGAKTTYRASSGLTAFDFAKMNKNLPHDSNYWALNTSGENR
jgi:ankyrin repeat protein